jgi:hypothetical protein
VNLVCGDDTVPKLIVRPDRAILVQDDGEATAQILSWGKERKIIDAFLEVNRELLADDLYAELVEVYLGPLADWPFRIPIGRALPDLAYLTLWVSWGQLPQVQVGLWMEPETTIHTLQQVWSEIASWRDRARTFNEQVLGGVELDAERWLKVSAFLHQKGQSYSEIAQILERYAAGLIRTAMRSYAQTGDPYLPAEITDALVSLLGTFGHSLDRIKTYLKEISQELIDVEPEDLFLPGRLITGNQVKEKLRYYRKVQERKPSPGPPRATRGAEKH